MHAIKKLSVGCLVISLAAFAGSMISGCVSANPPSVITTANPTPGLPSIVVTNPPTYAVSPILLNDVSNIQADAAALAPVVSAIYPPAAPVIPIGQAIIAALAGLVTTVSAGVAWFKTNQAASHSAAAATLAAIVAQNPATETAAMNLAGSNGTAPTVATHLASAKSLT